MLAPLLHLILALGAAAILLSVLERRDARVSSLRYCASFALLGVFAVQAMSWLAVRFALAPNEFPVPAPLAEDLSRGLVGAGLGGLAFAFVRRTPGSAASGALAGVVSAVLGYWARRWLAVAVALKLLGGFSGVLLAEALAPALAASGALAGAALVHEELAPVSGRLLAALVLAWSLPAAGSEWYLRSRWGYGPASLSQAAGVPAASRAGVLRRAWLKDANGSAYRFEPVRLAAESLDASVESLERLERYVAVRRYRTVFARQALRSLRQGWRLSWDADRAIEADMASSGGQAVPDYRGALALLRAGPLTPGRLRKLERLAVLAGSRREGFEDVTQSQYIFEGFSAAFARFGDEEKARQWLYKIDDLWPIYDKKIEVSPVEGMRDGEISGSLFLDGSPAVSVLVGLFYQPASTSSAKGFYLSGSDRPDPAGRFRFTNLGPGTYYLGLQGQPSQVTGRIVDSPGLVELSEASPAASLRAIRIERP